MRLTVSWNSSIISHETIYQLQFTSNSQKKKTKNTCNWYNHTSAQSETGSSKTTTVITLWICLLASRATIASIHVCEQNFKILKLVLGDLPGRVHPSSSHKGSVHPGLLIGRVPVWKRGGTEVHRFLGVPEDLKCQGCPCHNISLMNSTHY